MQLEEVFKKCEDAAIGVADFLEAAWQRPYSKEILLAIGALIVLLFIIRAIRKRFEPVKLFNNSAGVVTVTRKALDELVQSVCYSMGALNRPSIKVKTRRGRLSLLITLKMEMGQKLSEVSASIQEELTNALREHLGVEKLGRIDVRIKGFRGVLKKPAVNFKPIEEIENTPDPIDSNDPFAPNRL